LLLGSFAIIKLLSRWHTCEKLFRVYQQRKETVCSIFISLLDDGVLKFINLIEQLKTVAESSYSNAMSCNIITSLSDIFNITKIKFEKFEKGIYKLRNVFS